LALAVAVALYFRFRQWEGTVGQKLLALVPFIVAVLAPAGLHLLVIGWTHPEDLAFWLKNIYFGVFASAGISGSKLAGAGVATNWVHPFWYYAPALYRDHFFLTPILVLGLFPALRDRRFPRQFLWIIGAGLAGLLPLSLIKVKEPLYVLSCSIFLYFLAGLCLSALTRRISARGGLDPLSFKVGMVMSIALLVLFPLAYVKGIQPDKITKGFVIVHSVSYLLFLAVLLWSRFKVNAVFFERSIYALCAAAILVSFGYDSTTRPPRDKAIASLLRPYLQANPPNALSMIASNFKSYQFYSFHKGCYWHELSLKDGPETVLAAPQFEQVRAFVLDPDDQHRAEMASWITWLESHASEKTSELDARLGKPTGFRVFVRDSAQHAAR